MSTNDAPPHSEKPAPSFRRTSRCLVLLGSLLVAQRAQAQVDLQPLDCSRESFLASVSAVTATSVQFINETGQTVLVYWLNYSGARVLYKTLGPSQSYLQQTYVTHPWVAADTAGTCVAIFLPAQGPGVARIRAAPAGSTVLRLGNGRFGVEVAWRALSTGATGVGQAVPITSDTGYFWFFNSANVELVVKVLDGRPVNGKFWVFYAALSNVEYTITVTDTRTGAVKTYFNPEGQLASVADTVAFSDAGGRTTVDQPDDQTGYQVKAMYVLPNDGIDQNRDTDGTIATSVAAFQRWLERESGGKRLRTDTFQGALDITFVRLAQTDAAIASSGAFVRDRIEGALRAAGFNDPKKIYAVYYGGSSNFACGGGPWPPRLVGSVAAIYLRGTPPNAAPCSTNRFASSETAPGYLEFSMLHEIFHALGVVATCAPHYVLDGHTSDDPMDLMYAGPLSWQPSQLDTNRDDYYRHGTPCLDVAKSVFLTPTDPGAIPPPGWP